MFKITLIHRIISSCLLILFINLSISSSNVFSQQQNETKPKKEIKPKIIFENQGSDTIKSSSLQDTTKSKIIFKNSYFMKKDELKLISSKKFEFKGEEKMVGDKGEYLIEAMGSNQRAISMVNEAYKTKENGKLLMVLGVAAALVTLAIIPAVELGSTESGGYVTTYYWLPFITVGCIVGGIGYSKYNSVEKKLDEAVKIYNEDLVIQTENDDSK